MRRWAADRWQRVLSDSSLSPNTAGRLVVASPFPEDSSHRLLLFLSTPSVETFCLEREIPEDYPQGSWNYHQMASEMYWPWKLLYNTCTVKPVFKTP